MLVNDYQEKAMATLNPALDKKDVLLNSVMGLCGESEEAIDIVKKWLMQGHELDKEEITNEYRKDCEEWHHLRSCSQ